VPVVRLVVIALLSAGLTVVLSILFGIYGVFFPRTGPMVFLIAEAIWIVSMVVILVRGLMRIRADGTRAKRKIAFSVGALSLIGLSYAWDMIRGTSR
jgi:hypothetical protein